MADVHDKQTRSYNMSQIKGKNTKPEIIVRKYLFAKGFRFRIHCKELPGKPDIVLPKYKTAIFVDGCFWHFHKECKSFKIPKTNTKWWLEKLEINVKRDEENYVRLKEKGWKVVRLWECELKGISLEKTLPTCVNKIISKETNA